MTRRALVVFCFAFACDAPRPASHDEAPPAHVDPTPWGGLEVQERGDGPNAVVLLHGYGARGDDLVGFAESLAAELPTVRFAVPAAPLSLGRGARAWFPIPNGARGPESRRAVQSSIDGSREKLEGVLRTLEHRGVPSERVVVAGFSQGAMMSLDLALRGPERVRGVGFLSGAPLPDWPMARAAGLPVFASHGSSDDILPLAETEPLITRLRAANAEVELETFQGGHSIPREVRTTFLRWLRARFEG
ncbi:MAG: dienelactone hydrolase family protein [Sandaracinus sp.]|nr:dienelactone hydrolase family protein [Sandaracinus sp.]MCB9604855.1 dienelactone hydrolase family protein [Sandaracinus sp.]